MAQTAAAAATLQSRFARQLPLHRGAFDVGFGCLSVEQWRKPRLRQQPFSHGFAVTAPLTQGSLSRPGIAAMFRAAIVGAGVPDGPGGMWPEAGKRAATQGRPYDEAGTMP